MTFTIKKKKKKEKEKEWRNENFDTIKIIYHLPFILHLKFKNLEK